MTTKPSIALSELIEKGADTDLLRQMIQYVAQRMMEMDAEGLCAAAYGERSPDRANSRNGYRERLWETRAGSVDLKIPKLRSGQLLPGVPGAAPHGGEGAGGGDPGGLHPGRLHPLGRRAGQGHGHDRDLQEPGRRLCGEIDERVHAFLDRPHRRGLAIPVDRCDLREGTGGRPDRLQGRNNRRSGQHRRRARSARHGGRAERSRALLDRVPALPHPPRSAGRKACDLRRPRRPQGRRRQGAGRHVAALQGALPAERPGARRQGPAADGAGGDQHRVRAGLVRLGKRSSGVSSPISCARSSPSSRT